MNNQQLFNQSAEHILRQRVPALEDGNCRYRTFEGLSCGVGCLIPDEDYDARMEGYTIRELSETRTLWMRPIRQALGPLNAPSRVEFLVRLQRAHDNALGGGIESWRAEMRRIARNYRLSDAVLDKETGDV